MPELPEVETMRRGLAVLVGHAVQRAEASGLALRSGVFDPTPLLGNTLDAIERRGKALIWRFARGALVCAPGMTGLWLIDRAPIQRRHRHLALDFGNWHAAFIDPRRFALLYWCEGDPYATAPLARLGPEPFACRPEELARICAQSRTPIKPLLMDGRRIAGIGNIYANEICFAAGIDPRRPANGLAPSEIEALHQAMRKVLSQAIAAGGATIRDFAGTDGRPGYFAHAFCVYGRENKPCPRCNAPIARIRQQGRSTFFCARCQH